MTNRQLARGNFYGRTLKRRRTAGFNLYEARYAPGSGLPRHSHELPYFCLVLRGTYTESYGQGDRACRPSMLIYHPAGELHAQHFGDAAVRLFRIEVDRPRLREVICEQPYLERPADSRAGLVNVLARKMYGEFCAPDEASHLAIEGLALELLAATARLPQRDGRAPARPPRWLARARELVRSCFAEHLTLRDVARAAGVHPVTLAREFRRHYGCTVGEMVRRERVEFARREILRPETTLAEVAAAAGFYDQSHFSKTFKQMTGLTPARYRARR